jgi:hypothetical protein
MINIQIYEECFEWNYSANEEWHEFQKTVPAL